jgi:hypothetical protein
VDTNRIFVIGQSAGGHLSALCATLGDGVLEKTGGWESASSKVAAAIAVAGPFELEPDDGAHACSHIRAARVVLTIVSVRPGLATLQACGSSKRSRCSPKGLRTMIQSMTHIQRR